MKRKVYFQVSILLYLVLIIILTITFGCIYVMIFFIKDLLHTATTFEWAGFIASIFGFFYTSYSFVRMAKNRIILDNTKIYVPNHWGGKDYKLQYELHISYLDINNIYLVLSNRNSLNKPLKWATLPMAYIVIDCNDKTQKNINVFYYSKKQVIQIIDEIKKRAELLGNDLHIKSGSIMLNDFLLLIKKDSRNKQGRNKRGRR